MEILAFLKLGFELLPLVVKAGQDVAAFVQPFIEVSDGREITDEDLAHLREMRERLTAELNEPIPGEDEV